MTDNREAFEAWYDAQPDGRIQPWDVWQAATAATQERCAQVCEAIQPTPAWHDAPEVVALKAERDAAMKDTKRVDWYEQNEVTVLHIGKCWYSRQDYGEPIRRQNSFRDAVDAAIAKAEGGAS